MAAAPLVLTPFVRNQGVLPEDPHHGPGDVLPDERHRALHHVRGLQGFQGYGLPILRIRHLVPGICCSAIPCMGAVRIPSRE